MTNPPIRSVLMLTTDSRIDRRIIDQARSLVRVGWHVNILAGQAPTDTPSYDEQLNQDLNIFRLNTIADDDTTWPIDGDRLMEVTEKFPRWWWLNHYPDGPKYLTSAVMKPASVITAHDMPVLPFAAMAASYLGSFLVYDSHEIYPESCFFSRALKSHYRKMDAWLQVYADKVMTVNQGVSETLKRIWKRQDDIDVILNSPSVDVPLPVARTNKIREATGIPNDMTVILYQGNLSSNIRNLENLARAVSLSKRDDFALVYLGPDMGAEKDIIAIANESGLLNNRIYILPYVPQNELLSYSASADLGVIPYPHTDLNYLNCTPNKLYEFIVAGLPILANDSPELNRFVSAQGIGINMPLRTSLDIAAGIDQILSLNLEAIRSRCAEVAPLFTWDIQGKKVVKIYESLITSGIAPRSSDQSLSTAEIAALRGDSRTVVSTLEQLSAKLGSIRVGSG